MEISIITIFAIILYVAFYKDACKQHPNYKPSLLWTILLGWIYIFYYQFTIDTKEIAVVLLAERDILKKQFVADMEKLHKEMKDPTEFKKASLELAEQYDNKQRIRSLDFKEMLNNFNWK